MRVLFCVDGSEASLYAIRKTLPFLREDAEVNLINVIDWGFMPTYVTFPYETEDSYPNQRNVAEQILDGAVEMIKGSGYEVAKKEFVFGHADKIILEYARDNEVDLIVLGSHGKKGIQKWLGSVSRKIVSSSSIPVLVARPAKNILNTVQGHRVLFSSDGSKCSYNAISVAADLFKLAEADIEILTVRAGAESLPIEIAMDNEWLARALAKQQEIADEILDNAKKVLEEKGLHARKLQSMEGGAAEVILEYVEDCPKDLLIMGSHGREGISDILIGSVSKRVLDNSDTPVLIIPTKKAKEES